MNQSKLEQAAILAILSDELEPYLSPSGEPCIDGLFDCANKLIEYWQSLTTPAGNEEWGKGWDSAITVANNLCIQFSDDYNSDDQITEADIANKCAIRIRKLYGDRSYKPEKLFPESTPSKPHTVEKKETFKDMKLLIDFINDFKPDKRLKYGIACLVQAYLARFGVDVSDDARQEFQDKCVDDLVDEVLDNILSTLTVGPKDTVEEGQTQEPVKPKPVKERDNLDLLELVCQTHSKAAMYWNNKEMHNAYVEARMEMESRLTPPPSPVGIDVGQLFDNNFDCYTISTKEDESQGEDIPAMTKQKFAEILAGYSASLPQSSTEEEKGWNQTLSKLSDIDINIQNKKNEI